jgi:hypothetical protein
LKNLSLPLDGADTAGAEAPATFFLSPKPVMP